jgi:hypothetical protein
MEDEPTTTLTLTPLNHVNQIRKDRGSSMLSLLGLIQDTPLSPFKVEKTGMLLPCPFSSNYALISPYVDFVSDFYNSYDKGQLYVPFKLIDESVSAPGIPCKLFGFEEEHLPSKEYLRTGFYIFIHGLDTYNSTWIGRLPRSKAVIFDCSLQVVWCNVDDPGQFIITNQLQALHKYALESAEKALAASTLGINPSTPANSIIILPDQHFAKNVDISCISRMLLPPGQLATTAKVVSITSFDNKVRAFIWDGTGRTNQICGNMPLKRDSYNLPTTGTILPLFLWKAIGTEFNRSVKVGDWIKLAGFIVKPYEGTAEINSTDDTFTFEVLPLTHPEVVTREARMNEVENLVLSSGAKPPTTVTTGPSSSFSSSKTPPKDSCSIDFAAPPAKRQQSHELPKDSAAEVPSSIKMTHHVPITNSSASPLGGYDHNVPLLSSNRFVAPTTTKIRLAHSSSSSSNFPITSISKLLARREELTDGFGEMFLVRAKLEHINPTERAGAATIMLACSSCSVMHRPDEKAKHKKECIGGTFKQTLNFSLRLKGEEGEEASIRVSGMAALTFLGVYQEDITSYNHTDETSTIAKKLSGLRKECGQVADFFILAEPINEQGVGDLTLFGTMFHG